MVETQKGKKELWQTFSHAVCWQSEYESFRSVWNPGVSGNPFPASSRIILLHREFGWYLSQREQESVPATNRVYSAVLAWNCCGILSFSMMQTGETEAVSFGFWDNPHNQNFPEAEGIPAIPELLLQEGDHRKCTEDIHSVAVPLQYRQSRAIFRWNCILLCPDGKEQRLKPASNAVFLRRQRNQWLSIPQ